MARLRGRRVATLRCADEAAHGRQTAATFRMRNSAGNVGSLPWLPFWGRRRMLQRKSIRRCRKCPRRLQGKESRASGQCRKQSLPV